MHVTTPCNPSCNLIMQSFKGTLDSNSYEKLKTLQLLSSLLTNQNSTHKEIKFRLKAGNSCYYSVQTLYFFRLLSKNLRIKIYKTIILPVVLYGCETWSLTLRKEHRVLENRILRQIFVPKQDKNGE